MDETKGVGSHPYKLRDRNRSKQEAKELFIVEGFYIHEISKNHGSKGDPQVDLDLMSFDTNNRVDNTYGDDNEGDDDDVHDDVAEEHLNENRYGYIVSDGKEMYREEKTTFRLDDAMVKKKEERLSDVDDVEGETLAGGIKHASSNVIQDRKSCRLLIKQAAECNTKKVDQERNKDIPAADAIVDHIVLAWDKALVALDDEDCTRKWKESNDVDSEEEEEQADVLYTAISTSGSPNIAVCVICGTVGLPNSPCLRCCMSYKIYGDQLFSGGDISAMNLPRYDCSIERWRELQRRGLWYPVDPDSIYTMKIGEEDWGADEDKSEDLECIDTMELGKQFWESRHEELESDVLAPSIDDAITLLFVNRCQSDGEVCQNQSNDDVAFVAAESNIIAVGNIIEVRDQMKINKHLKKPPLKDKREVAAPSMEVSIISQRLNNIWLGDSGASCHMTNDDAGMFDCRKYQSMITIGNGKSVLSPKIGKQKLLVIQKDGRTVQIVLHDVMFVPDLRINLFSITKALSQKWKLSNKGLDIVLSKYHTRIQFDHHIKTQSGFVSGVEMFAITDHDRTVMESKFFMLRCQLEGERISKHLGYKVLKFMEQHTNKLSDDVASCTRSIYGVCSLWKIDCSFREVPFIAFDKQPNLFLIIGIENGDHMMVAFKNG